MRFFASRKSMDFAQCLLNVKIPIKSVFNKNQKHNCYNIFFEKYQLAKK